MENTVLWAALSDLEKTADAVVGSLCCLGPRIFLASYPTMVGKHFKDTGSYGLVSTIGLLCFLDDLKREDLKN